MGLLIIRNIDLTANATNVDVELKGRGTKAVYAQLVTENCTLGGGGTQGSLQLQQGADGSNWENYLTALQADDSGSAPSDAVKSDPNNEFLASKMSYSYTKNDVLTGTGTLYIITK